jgi:hypothetical protein
VIGAAERSHAFRLMRRLFDLGFIPRGKFSWVHVWHDGDCAALAPGCSNLNCNCDPEIEIGDRRYLSSDFVEPGTAQ